MIPFDGTGYGRSLYWAISARDIARQNGELCPCWDKKIPELYYRTKTGYMCDIKIKVKCADGNCNDVNFEKKQGEIVKKFKEFYG